MFDELTKQNLKAYVYMLVNPEDKKPFYIGKGNGNRVFDHLNCALTDEDATSGKYDIIRQIQNAGNIVEHVVVRHGLSDSEAFHIEAALIDAFVYSGILLSNRAGGHNSIEKGLMTCDEIKRLYNAEPLDTLPNNCIIININRNYKRGTGENAIYQATKGVWAINMKNLVGPEGALLRKYVLSEYKGLIVEVFEVERWFPANRGFTLKARKYGQMRIGVEFEGRVAPKSIRDLYINKSIAHHKKRGAATAHRLRLSDVN